MSATVIYILFVISTGNLPDFTALAAYQSKDACVAAAAEVNKALSSGQDAKTALCLSSDSLNALAATNGLRK
jgi:uncharacterized protein YjaG (DUF416 family)